MQFEGNIGYDAIENNFNLTLPNTDIPYAKITTSPNFSLKIGDGINDNSFITYNHDEFDGRFLINCSNHRPYVIFTPIGPDPITLGGGFPGNCSHQNHGLNVNPATSQNADFYININYNNDACCSVLDTSIFNVAIPILLI